MNKLHTFFGGLKLPSENKNQLAIEAMPLSAQLEFALHTHKKQVLQACVSEGDYVITGQPLAMSGANEMTAAAPLLSSACGTVVSIGQNRLVLETDQAQDQRYQLPAMNSVDLSALAARLYHCGVLGLGGAAFPGATKLQSLSEQPLDTLVINAAECEPVICCDQALIRESAALIAESIVKLASRLNARQCLIGIEDCNTFEHDLLQQALVKLEAKSVKLISIPTLYPSGSEKQLIKILTGVEIPAHKLPSDYAILNFNIATAQAALAAWETGQPLTSRVLTVAGDALSGVRNVRAHFGTRFTDLFAFMGIDSTDHHQVTLGGPMTGVSASAADSVVSAASNCVLINQSRPQRTALPCIRCGECDKVCPAQLLPQQLHWFCQSNNLPDAEKFHLNACIECGCCDYVCPSNIALTNQFRTAKNTTAEQQRAAALATIAQHRFDARTARLQRKTEERERRLQQRKAEVEKKTAQQTRSSQTAETGKQTTPDQDAIAAALARARERKLQRKQS